MPATRLLLILSALLLASFTCSPAQKADVSLTVGATFVSDSNVTSGPLCPVAPSQTCPTGTVSSGHHVYIAGTPALQLLGLKVVSLSLEVPIAGIPNHNLQLSGAIPVSGNPGGTFGHISSLFVTPALRLKVLPGAGISPFVSLGGGFAHYSLDNGSSTRGAIQYGGGLDFKTGIPLLGFRAEVRDFLSEDPNFGTALGASSGPSISAQSGLHHHNILAGGGVVLRF